MNSRRLMCSLVAIGDADVSLVSITMRWCLDKPHRCNPCLVLVGKYEMRDDRPIRNNRA
jgi:hypothetical protein